MTMKRKIAGYVVLFSFLICAGIWLLWDRHKSPGDGSEADSQEDLIFLYIPDDIVRIELVNNVTREKRVIIRNRESIQEICGELRAFAGEKADISGEEQPRYTVYCYRDKSTKCTEIQLISEDEIYNYTERVKIIRAEEKESAFSYVEKVFKETPGITDYYHGAHPAARDSLHTPFLIIENPLLTAETVWITEGVFPKPGEYVRIYGCVLYANGINAEDCSEGILVPKESAFLLDGQEAVLIRIWSGTADNRECLFSLLNEEETMKYLPFVNGRIQMPESLDDCKSYAFLLDMNSYIDSVKEASDRGAELSEDARLIPKQRLSGGMTVQEVIDFFEAWRNWSRFY